MATDYKKKTNKSYVYFNKKTELKVIVKLQNLIEYTYLMIKKFPKDEMLNLASDMKAAAFSAMESLIYAKVTNSNKQKILYITSAEAKLNILNILVRLAKKNKFITQRNYNVWSFKITEISDMLRKWRSFCQK